VSNLLKREWYGTLVLYMRGVRRRRRRNSAMYIEGDVTVRALNIILTNVLAGSSASREPAREKFFFI